VKEIFPARFLPGTNGQTARFREELQFCKVVSLRAGPSARAPARRDHGSGRGNRAGTPAEAPASRKRVRVQRRRSDRATNQTVGGFHDTGDLDCDFPDVASRGAPVSRPR